MKKVILSLILVATLLSPFSVQAQVSSDTQTILDQITLLKEQLIQELIKQIAELQKQLADMIAVQSAQTATLQAQGTAIQQIVTNTAPREEPIETNVILMNPSKLKIVGEDFKTKYITAVQNAYGAWKANGLGYTINGGNLNEIINNWEVSQATRTEYIYSLTNEIILPKDSEITFVGIGNGATHNPPWLKSITLVGQTTGKIVTLP